MRVNVVKFGSTDTVEVPSGATLAEVLDVARVDANSNIRYRGQTVAQESLASTTVTEGATVVVAPPQVKHG